MIGTDKYNLAAEMGFYTRAPEDTVNGFALGDQGLGYRYWTQLSRFDRRPAVAILTESNEAQLARLRGRFDKVEEPILVRIAVGDRTLRQGYLVKCYGYHAVPPTDR